MTKDNGSEQCQQALENLRKGHEQGCVDRVSREKTTRALSILLPGQSSTYTKVKLEVHQPENGPNKQDKRWRFIYW